jgi:hypothetical protein
MQRLVQWAKRAPASILVAAVLAVGVAMSAGAVVTARTASDHFADAAFGKLGGDPQAVLNKIADRVVRKLDSKDGPLSDAQSELVDRIAGIAGQKFDGVDPNKMLNDVKGQVTAAGLAKLDEVDPQVIVDRVTQALIAQAMDQVDNIDLEAIVGQKVGTLDLNAIVREQVNKIDINKLVRDELAKVDLNALIKQVITQKMGSGSSVNLLNQLLGGLSR